MEKFYKLICFSLITASVLSLINPSLSMDFLDESQASSYLEKYGYLTPLSSRSFQSSRSFSDLIQAIKDMQYNMNLEETGVLDLETKKLMETPRCGIKDELRNHRNRRFTLHRRKWNKTHLTWSLKSNKRPEVQGNIRQDLNDAFKVWQSKTVFTFEEVNSVKPDILIEFYRLDHRDGGPFDGPGGTLAHAFYPESGLVHFDDDEEWIFGKHTNREQEGSNFFDAAVHEFGHTLGLAHSHVKGAIMNPYMAHDNRYLSLHEDEIEGMTAMYGSHRETERHTERPVRTTTESYERRATSPDPEERLDPVDPSTPVIPDCCNTNYDALTKYRGELFIFKDEYNWRVTSQGIMSGYPVHTRRMWNLPENFKKIDAVYENSAGHIVFFVGKRFYKYDANTLKDSGLLSDLGLPEDLENIDAIFIWGKKPQTFIFSNARNEYWKFDEETRRVDEEYPRKTNPVWRKVDGFDAAFQHKGTTYFFKGKNYYEFDDDLMRLKIEEPKISAHDWMKCKATQGDLSLSNSSKSQFHVANLCLTVLICCLVNALMCFYKF